jgi:hypothetical protein
MKTLDYFEELSTTFDFVPMSNTEIESSVNMLISSASELESEIALIEKRVLSVEKDIEVIAELGTRLENESSRKKLEELAQDFMMSIDINDMRTTLAKLYGTRQSIAKSVARLSSINNTIDLTCGVCLENLVGTFNHECGHTCCESCSSQVTRCPFCRARACFRKLIFLS